jgi:type I restriction enzyme R subunit
LVVDYLGLAHELKKALANYTGSGGKGQTAVDQDEAAAEMLKRYEICCDLFHGFDWSRWVGGTPAEKLSLLPAAQEHILQQEDGKNRLLKVVSELSSAFALAVPHEDALLIRDDVGLSGCAQYSQSLHPTRNTRQNKLTPRSNDRFLAASAKS